MLSIHSVSKRHSATMLFNFKFTKMTQVPEAVHRLRYKPWVSWLCRLLSLSYRKGKEESLEAVTSVVITVENFVKVRYLAFDVCL